MCTNAPMMLSVQRGPCWAANSSSLYELLAKEGAIEGVVEYDQGKGRGSFVFYDEEVLLSKSSYEYLEEGSDMYDSGPGRLSQVQYRVNL